MPLKARLVVYDFDDPVALEEQLGRSQNEGTKVLSNGRRITVLNIPDAFMHSVIRWLTEQNARDLPEEVISG